jgi:hypothetical protein
LLNNQGHPAKFVEMPLFVLATVYFTNTFFTLPSNFTKYSEFLVTGIRVTSPELTFLLNNNLPVASKTFKIPAHWEISSSNRLTCFLCSLTTIDAFIAYFLQQHQIFMF